MRAAVLLMGFLFLAGCLEADDGGGPGAGPPAGGQPERAIVLRTLEEGQQSGHREAGRRLIADEGEWQEFWAQHRRAGPIGMEADRAPAVDFASERVVAVTLGQRGNGCWSVRVTNATTDGRDTTLSVTTYAPPPQMPCIDVVTYPYHFVALPADGTNVSFFEATQTYPPGPTPTTPIAQPPAQATPPVVDKSLQPRPLAQGSASGIGERMREVLDDEASWDAFWARHAARGTAGEQPPVDFAKERVVAVLNGEKPNACHELRVTSVGFSGGPSMDNATRVVVTTYVPAPDRACAEVVTRPFVLLAVPKAGGPVSFEEREETGPAPTPE